MGSTILGLALVFLFAGFVILASSIKSWINPQTKAQVGNRSLALGIAIVACAVSSGLLFLLYFGWTQRQGQIARLQVYEEFSELPRVDRLASAGLSTTIQNDDEIGSDGSTSLTVALLPKNAFFSQFAPWGKSDRLLLKMHVIAPDFEVSPVLDETQQVPGDAMTFAWILRAQGSGDQIVNVRGVAFRETGAGIVYDRATVVNSMRSIRVTQPFSMEAWTPIVTGLIGLLGTGALPLLIHAKSGKHSEDDSLSSRAGAVTSAQDQ